MVLLKPESFEILDGSGDFGLERFERWKARMRTGVEPRVNHDPRTEKQEPPCHILKHLQTFPTTVQHDNLRHTVCKYIEKHVFSQKYFLKTIQDHSPSFIMRTQIILLSALLTAGSTAGHLRGVTTEWTKLHRRLATHMDDYHPYDWDVENPSKEGGAGGMSDSEKFKMTATPETAAPETAAPETGVPRESDAVDINCERSFPGNDPKRGGRASGSMALCGWQMKRTAEFMIKTPESIDPEAVYPLP